MTTTENMGLVLGTVSETLGPEWAQILNTALEVIDLHDHSDGNGAKVTPAGILINAALDLLTYALQNGAFIGLVAQPDGDDADAGSIVRIGTNLWWKNSAGVMVQITSGTTVVSTGSGAIALATPGAYPYTIVTGDAQKVLAVDTAAAARALTLPAATNAMFLMIKDVSGNAQTNKITISRAGSDTIDGASSYEIDANYGSVGLVSDGVASWYVV